MKAFLIFCSVVLCGAILYGAWTYLLPPSSQEKLLTTLSGGTYSPVPTSGGLGGGQTSPSGATGDSSGPSISIGGQGGGSGVAVDVSQYEPQPTTTKQGYQTQTTTVPPVVQAFLNETGTSSSIALGKTITVSSYALQLWSTQNEGGIALLKYTSASGWKVVTMGGGYPDARSLSNMGVPQAIAEQLIAKIK